MRITYLAAGAGGNYCGACQRDVALIRGLLARGHDARMLELYTPVRTDGPLPPRSCVFYGGVNVYLQQRFAVFRHTPRFVDWVLDRRRVLDAASRFAVETRPEELGEMTVSVLRGPAGAQRKELSRLVRFLEPETQIRLPLYLLAVSVIFGLIMLGNVWGAYASLYRMAVAVSPISFGAIFRAQTLDFVLVSFAIGIGYAAVVFGLSAGYLHRLIGPTVALQRQVQSLKKGEYAARVVLRDGQAVWNASHWDISPESLEEAMAAVPSSSSRQ